MKTLVVLLVGLAALLVTAGCEEEHEHHHHPYGGAYEGPYQGYGHGSYDWDRGYRVYPDRAYPPYTH